MTTSEKVEFDQGVLHCGDCLKILPKIPSKSIDLVFGSPPYESQRLYKEDGKDLGIARDTEEWVSWMVEVFKACLRVSKGLVALVVGHGTQEDFRWSGAPVLLYADLIRSGVCTRCPPLYKRNGIMGSGGPDWLRSDYEFVICATHGGELPWSDNTACGRPPVCRVGGSPSHRTHTDRRVDGSRENRVYNPPELANPGNVIDCGAVGGGNISDTHLAHVSEAPFPEKLAEFFVRSFCPPGGTVLDAFMGGGTTAAVCVKNNRRFVGIDLRPSQVELATKRVQVALRNVPLI